MKAILLPLLLLICPGFLKAQSDLIRLQDHLVGLTPDTTHRKWHPEEVKSIKEFWKIFKEIRERENGFDYLRGNVAFGFTGNSSETSELYRLHGGITLSKGTYPQEFEFSTQLNIQVDDGNLQENLSNLRITYDRFIPLKKHKFLMEGYSFVNRRSDQYLGVNQRYEIGGGMIFAHWQQKLYKKSQEEKDNYMSDRIKFLPESEQIIICEQSQCVPVRWEGLTKEDSTIFSNSQNRIANSIIKRNTPLRAGMLFGVFLELESISHSDSLKTITGNQYFSHDFTTTTLFRWELRPTLDFRISEQVVFKIRPYIKLPLPWDWTTTVDGKKVADYRIEFPVSLGINLSDKFRLSFKYTFYYDNAPNSFLVGEPGIGGIPLYLTANKKHHFYDFQVVYEFN